MCSFLFDQSEISGNNLNGTVSNIDLSRRFPFTKVLGDRKLYSRDTLHPEVDHNKMMKPVLYGVLTSLQYL